MSVWYPYSGGLSYVEWAQEESFAADIKGALCKNSSVVKSSIQEQTSAMSDYAKQIVASNQQIKSAIEGGFERLANINEHGFSKVANSIENVASAIESMHSDMNYNFGVLTQQMEFQNGVLTNILQVLQEPFDSEVHELYNKGCKYIQQGILTTAIKYLKKSIALPTGEEFFPSNYQLGRIYLLGKDSKFNFFDPKTATEFLLIANKYGEGISRTDEAFNPVLADCKLLLSQSYYFQLSGKKNTTEVKLLNNAIKYAEESIELNPNLSQGYYHLAKYYSKKVEVEELLSNLEKAIEIDRKYAIQVFNDGIFEPNINHITELIDQLRVAKEKMVQPKLNKEKSLLAKLEQKNISQYPQLYDEFKKLKAAVLSAEKDFQTKTYFGIDDCQIKLGAL